MLKWMWAVAWVGLVTYSWIFIGPPVDQESRMYMMLVHAMGPIFFGLLWVMQRLYR